jgi:hypothetical protein
MFFFNKIARRVLLNSIIGLLATNGREFCHRGKREAKKKAMNNDTL